MAELHALDPEFRDDGVGDLIANLQVMDEAGQIASIGVAIVGKDGVIRNKWTTGGSFARLLGAAARLTHKLNEAMDDAA